jgi:hypothetical protein
MDLGTLIVTVALLAFGGAALRVYSQSEHGFFTLRELKRQVRRLTDRRRWQH